MRNKQKLMFIRNATLLGFLFFLSSCDDTKTAEALKNAGAKAVQKCSAYGTENQRDGENSVSRSWRWDYHFNLYWNGPKEKFSVWEDNGLNDYYEVTFKPLTIHVLGDGGQETTTIVCAHDKASASKCIERFEAVLKMTKEARQSYKDVGGTISDGKEMTFKCTEEFIEKSIHDLRSPPKASANEKTRNT